MNHNLEKMLFILNPENKWHRLLRRALAMGAFAFVAVLIKSNIPNMPEMFVPIAVAIIAAIDKYTRNS